MQEGRSWIEIYCSVRLQISIEGRAELGPG
jgi:hypothetical protein